MKRAWILTLVLGMLLPPAAVRALGLEEVLAAVAAHPELAASRYEARAAAADVDAVRAEGGWQIEGRFETLLRYAREGGEAAPLVTDRERLVFARPLYDGGRRAARVAGAEATARAAADESRLVRDSLLLAAVEAYAAVMRDRALVEAALAAERRLALLLAMAQRRYRLGGGTAAEVARVEARHAAAVAVRKRAVARLTESGARFRRLVGAAPAELEPATPPADLPNELDEVLAALEDHPALAAARARLAAAEARLREMQAAGRADLSLTGSLARTGGADPRRESRADLAVGAVLRLPLYDSGLVRARTRAARARLAAARARLEETQRRLEAEARTALARWRMAATLWPVSERRLAAARLALEAARREVVAGTRPLAAVLEAEDALAEAETARARLQAERLVAGYRLAAVLGRFDRLIPADSRKEEPLPEADAPIAEIGATPAVAPDPVRSAVRAMVETPRLPGGPNRSPTPTPAAVAPRVESGMAASAPAAVVPAALATVAPAAGPAEGAAVDRRDGVLYGRLTEGG